MLDYKNIKLFSSLFRTVSAYLLSNANDMSQQSKCVVAQLQGWDETLKIIRTGESISQNLDRRVRESNKIQRIL
jgi:hypothetical protein